MHIILVSDRMATAKTLTVTRRHLVLGAVGLAMLVLALSALFALVTLRHAADVRLPFVQELLLSVRAEEAQRTQSFMRENINAMAVRIGEMQAKLMRLDTLGERLGGLVGIRSQELKTDEKPGQGGPLVESGSSPLTEAELKRQMEELSNQLEERGDLLGMIEAELQDRQVRLDLLPSSLPVAAPWTASAFGWRIDPFTGHRALHEGVDFPAEPGTPIQAAAAGIVLTAEHHPQYGNMLEIDHGNGLTTRYAHASKLLVQAGALVRRGQKVALVGSTGRSTGAHLHFEVRHRGVAQNPNRFLRRAQQSDPLLARKN